MPRLRQRDIALFFFPLLLNVQLMSISHTVINGALARLEDYVTALAGFSVAMVIHLFIASPSYQNHTVAIAMVRGRRSLKAVLLFVLLVAAYVSLMLSMIAFTPLGNLVLERILSTPPQIAEETRRTLRLLVLLPLFTGLRGLFQGLVIQACRTSLVSLATGVRVGFLLLLLTLGSSWFSGAALGAFALVGCIMIETLLMGLFAWRVHLPRDEEAVEDSTGSILRYAFPLAWSSCLQQTVPLLINAIISRLPDAPLALAAFGVIRGFLFLLAGPMRNLQQAYLTLVRGKEDGAVLIRFHLLLAIGMGLLILLVAGPMSAPVLGGWLGVADRLRGYITWPLAACGIFPLLYGTTNLLRGWFAGARQTARLGHSTLLKGCFILLLWPLILWLRPPLSGIGVAIMLLIAAEILETVYLARQRSKLGSEVEHLMPR